MSSRKIITFCLYHLSPFCSWFFPPRCFYCHQGGGYARGQGWVHTLRRFYTHFRLGRFWMSRSFHCWCGLCNVLARLCARDILGAHERFGANFTDTWASNWISTWTINLDKTDFESIPRLYLDIRFRIHEIYFRTYFYMQIMFDLEQASNHPVHPDSSSSLHAIGTAKATGRCSDCMQWQESCLVLNCVRGMADFLRALVAVSSGS